MLNATKILTIKPIIMKPQLFLYFLAIALFLSCKKENDDGTEPPGSGTKLTKMVIVTGSTTTTTNLTYDAGGKLARWHETETGGGSSAEDGFRIQRKADGMIDKIVFKRDGISDSITVAVNSSGSKYTSAQSTQSFSGMTHTVRTTFLYDNAGNITESTETDIYGNDPPDPKSRLKYTYVNGNITSMKVYRISGGANNLFIQHDLEYDQKLNPLASGADWIVLTSTGMLFGPHGSANNFTRLTIKRPGAGEIPITASYTYNDKNMPVTAVQKNAAGQVVATTTFTYQ
jgi:hypothetical protein